MKSQCKLTFVTRIKIPYGAKGVGLDKNGPIKFHAMHSKDKGGMKGQKVSGVICRGHSLTKSLRKKLIAVVPSIVLELSSVA